MMCEPGEFAGGLFWDGRATGWTLGDPLAEQAQGPFLNPLEQNNPNAKHVCLRVRESQYADLFRQVWGALDCVKGVPEAYERIARSIAAYERSAEVNPFSSKFDAFWSNWQAAKQGGARGLPQIHAINMMNKDRFASLGLDATELMGLAIFNTKANCSTCHSLQPMHGSEYPLFTDFRYHNLGIPKNPENPFYNMPRKWNPDGAAWVDPGLAGFLLATAGTPDSGGVARDYSAFAAENYGKHKTPSLRNVERRPYPEFVKSYGHNGYFKSLMEIIHFYNLRDVLPFCAESGNPPWDCRPEPEVPENINTTAMGNLGLTQMEGMALIQFLKTLSDE
jgi:cytochrome c peroxidase